MTIRKPGRGKSTTGSKSASGPSKRRPQASSEVRESRKITEMVDPRSRSRGKRIKVKSAKGRKISSTRWLERQLNDPYVAEAQRLGYRSRAAFKIIDIDKKFHLFKKANRIVDLGAAPGGWSQIAGKMKKPSGYVVGLDILEMEPMEGATFVQMDFLAPDAEQVLFDLMGGPADLVMSDMAANATGHRQTDHIRTLALCEAAADFAIKTLVSGGNFVAKVFRGGTEGKLLDRLKKNFESVKHFKPDSSRPESVELFVVALNFKGRSENTEQAPEMEEK